MNAIDRIYSASTDEEGIKARLAETLAKRIEDDIANRCLPPGGSLGSMGELSKRYSAGMAATREAIGLLERRGLGRLRPGRSGGFIIAEPRADAIAEELADYFRTLGITLRQLLDARETLDCMAAAMAASTHPNSASLEQLAASDGGLLSDHLDMQGEIARLTGEPAIELFTICLNSLTRDFAHKNTRPAADQPWRGSSTTQLLWAIAAGDRDAATSEAARFHRDLADNLVGHARHSIAPASEEPGDNDTRDLAFTVARHLALEITRNGRAGQRLGSEWDLCERFNVSRLTLRRAVRLLQDRGLVECRRGRGNGLIISHRHMSGGIRLVLAYLIAKKMDPAAAGTILFQMNGFIPALAVYRADTAQRQMLVDALSRVENGNSFSRYDLLRLVHCVSTLSDSPIIDFFSRCLAAYEARFHPALATRLSAHVQASYFALLRRLLDRLPAAPSDSDLAWAKAESAKIMNEMSLQRPI